MKFVTLIKANIKKQKLSFFGVFILMLIISTFTSATLSIWQNATERVGDEIERLGYGDIIYWTTYIENINELVTQMNEIEDIDRIEATESITVNTWYISEEESTNTLFVMEDDREIRPYNIMDEDGKLIEDIEQLKDNEVYVPISFVSMYDVEIGDTIKISDTYLIIKGYFEDPIMGSSIMGVKTILANIETFDRLYNQSKITNNIYGFSGFAFNVYQSQGSTLSTMKLETKIAQNSKMSEFQIVKLSKQEAINYMTIVITLLASVLIAFSILLLLVTLLILSHSISSSIELDYVNMGILKAVGYSKNKLQIIQLLQYLFPAFFGIIIGLPLSIFVIKFVNSLTIYATSILIESKIAIFSCGVALFIILLIIAGFIYLKTIKISKITPLLAIRGGKQDVYFDSRIKLPIFQKGLNIWLAIRQILSNKKQYITTCIITSFLIFFLALASNLSSWVGDSGEGISRMFSFYEVDFDIYYYDKSIQEEVEDTIRSYSEIKQQFVVASGYLLLDGNSIHCSIISDPEIVYSIIKGRTCLYENEILITSLVAENLNKSVGDSVYVETEGMSKEFIVSGIYDCGNDTGNNFTMNMEGYRYLTESTIEGYETYVLEDNSEVNQIIERLNQEYQEQLNASIVSNSGVSEIADAIRAISLLVYVVAIIFVFIVIVMVCDKIFIKEQNDIGIYKAIGVPSLQLRIQFSLRILIIVLIGGGIGLILNLLLTSSLMGLLLKMIGITQFKIEFTLLAMVKPVALITILSMVFSFITSRKIKTVEPKNLINE